jgi:Cu/Ag efflux protein CusF
VVRLLSSAMLALLLAVPAWAQSDVAGEVRGTVQHIDPVARTVTFTDGNTVHLDPGATITMDGREVTIQELREGSAVAIRHQQKEGRQLAQPRQDQFGQQRLAHPPVSASGEVASIDKQDRTITFADGRVMRLSPEGDVWQATRLDQVRPGTRVFVREAEPLAFQGVTGDTRMATVVEVDRANRRLVLHDGTTVRVDDQTKLIMGEGTFAMDEIRPGDEVVISVRPGEARPADAPVTADVRRPTVDRDADVAAALPRFERATIDASEIRLMRRPQAP